jgi:uncharacterized protein YbjT (DUF2867 family)
VKVLVTGGTGALGRDVVSQLRVAGHTARVLSRKPGSGSDWVQGDLSTGAALDDAVRGMDVIIHAGSATVQPWKYGSTDVLGTRRLLIAARAAGVQHTVYVSIVGIEGIAYAYYRTKLAAESVVRESMVPWSIVRATQFHTLMEVFLRGFSSVPGMCAVPFRWQFQPVDTQDVAARLISVVAAKPAGMLPDFGGPLVRDFKSIAESWLAARKMGKRLVNLWLPLKFSRQFAEGRLLCPDHRDGTITFEQYLQRKYGAGPSG